MFSLCRVKLSNSWVRDALSPAIFKRTWKDRPSRSLILYQFLSLVSCACDRLILGAEPRLECCVIVMDFWVFILHEQPLHVLLASDASMERMSGPNSELLPLHRCGAKLPQLQPKRRPLSRTSISGLHALRPSGRGQCGRLQRGGPHYPPYIQCSYSTRTPHRSVPATIPAKELHIVARFGAFGGPIANRTELLSDMRLLSRRPALR